MIAPTNFSVSSAVSTAVSLTSSDESAAVRAHFQGILNSLKTQPLRVSPAVSKAVGDGVLAQQMQREGFIL